MGDLLRLGLVHDGSDTTSEQLTAALRDDRLADHDAQQTAVDWTEDCFDHVVGMDAPEAQAMSGSTSVWSRPIIRHWLASRPGNGWRTDTYGDHGEYTERLRHLMASRRQRRERRVA